MPTELTPDAIRIRFALYLVIVVGSLFAVAVLAIRKLRLRRRAGTLPAAVRRLSLEDLGLLEKLAGFSGVRALLKTLDSPTAFDRAYAALVRDGASRAALSFPEAERLHRIRVSLGHGRMPEHRTAITTRDLDPEVAVRVDGRTGIVLEVRENGLLVLDLARSERDLEKGHVAVVAFRDETRAVFRAALPVLDAAGPLLLLEHGGIVPLVRGRGTAEGTPG